MGEQPGDNKESQCKTVIMDSSDEDSGDPQEVRTVPSFVLFL